MSERTEAQKRAQQKYMEKFSRVEIKMTAKEKSTALNHAKERGESMNVFVNRAIKETIASDSRAEKEG